MCRPNRLVLLFLIFASGLGVAQTIALTAPSCGDDLSALNAELTTPEFVLRAAVIGQDRISPSLRSLALPGKTSESIREAAEIALAVLGDESSLKHLREQMNNPKTVLTTIGKVSQVRTDKGLSILVDYLISNRDNPHRTIIYGDTGQDPMVQVLLAIIAMTDSPPYTQPLTDKLHLQEWEKWWTTTTPPRVVVTSLPMPDSDSKCLARLGDFGFQDAPLALFHHLNGASVPALRSLTRVGNPIIGDKAVPTSPLGTVRGNAQAILAKLDDRAELDRIVKELDDPSSYGDAIEKLQYIANQAAFEALLKSLSLGTFMSDSPLRGYRSSDNRSYVAVMGEQLRAKVVAALSQMVKSPPLSPDAEPSEGNIKTWTEWWSANKSKDVLKTVPF